MKELIWFTTTDGLPMLNVPFLMYRNNETTLAIRRALDGNFEVNYFDTARDYEQGDSYVLPATAKDFKWAYIPKPKM